MIKITLYSRSNCLLCEQVKSDLATLQTQFPHELIEVDIESDPELHKKYLSEIPVVTIGPYMLKAPITRTNLLISLGAVYDATTQNEGDAKKDREKITITDRISLWLSKHWLLTVNLFFILYLGLPILAPVLMKAGDVIPARVIYTAYSPLCHQLGFRSFFLFGEQPYYPRAAAGVPGVITFGKATGINENDIISARSFIGNDLLGYKIALCERDVAIYGGIIIFGLIYGLSQKRIKAMNWAIWFLLALVPIGLDGFSQLFSQLPIPAISAILPYRESTPFLRVITGFLFGFCTAWFGLPYIEESMRETRKMVIKNG